MTANAGSDGTFSFCATCPAESHCCRRIRTSDALEPPFLLRDEALAIATSTHKDLHDFTEPESTNGERLSLRSVEGKCIFYKSGSCSVYDLRPMDCRLFPFDIIEGGLGQFIWIVYDDLCPATFDHKRHFENAKRVVAQSSYSAADLRSFADYGATIMKKHRYRVLEEIAL